MDKIKTEHRSFYRVSHGKTAVLMIHGILGTPRHFDGIIPVFPKDFDIYNILLDGHGKGISDFADSSMKKWQKQTHDCLCYLRKHYEKIYIVAHSMGSLLSMQATVKNHSKICGLILLNVPTVMHLTPKAISNCIKVAFNRIGEDDTDAITTKKACSIETTPNLLPYATWIPRYTELFALAHFVGKDIRRIKTPCIVFQSLKDELVSAYAMDIIKRNPSIDIKILKESGHYGYSENDLKFINNEIEKFLNREV